MRSPVFVPPYRVVPLLLLVLPAAGLAQPGSLEIAPATRQIELSQTPRPELWGAPGQTTWVLLDASLDTEAMRGANPAEGLRRMEVTERAVALVPAVGVEAGARLEFTLRFADGQPAEGVTLVLRVDRAKAEPEVEVYRGELPASALKRRVAALNAQVEALSAQEPSLAPLVATGLLGPRGVQSFELSRDIIKTTGPGLSRGDAWLHVATGRVALEVTLTLAPGAPAWVPGAIKLTEASTPEPLPVRSVKLLGGAALQPGNSTRLLVEWDTPLETEGLTYTLEVAEQSGPRGVTVKKLNTRSEQTRLPSKKETKP